MSETTPDRATLAARLRAELRWSNHPDTEALLNEAADALAATCATCRFGSAAPTGHWCSREDLSQEVLGHDYVPLFPRGYGCNLHEAMPPTGAAPERTERE